MAYSIFKAPLLSFYSKEFYKDTATKGKGIGFLYLFVVVFVANAISVTSACIRLAASVEDPAIHAVLAQLPAIHVRGGRMSIDKDSPYEMSFKNRVTLQPTRIVFDTNAPNDASLPDDVKMLLTAEEVKIENSSTPLKWSQITFGNDIDISGPLVKEYIKKLSFGFFLPVGILLFGPLAWIGHIFLVLIYGTVGLFMDRNKQGFGTALRMASVAITPTIVLCMLSYASFCLLELFPLLTIPISLGYLFFGYTSVGDLSTNSSLPPGSER